jgi:phosphoserine aminotransferase
MTLQEKTTVHNFGAGPSILPKEVFEEASRALIN